MDSLNVYLIFILQAIFRVTNKFDSMLGGQLFQVISFKFLKIGYHLVVCGDNDFFYNPFGDPADYFSYNLV
jgi:hypothetical protein